MKKALVLLTIVAMLLAVGAAFATNFCVNPGFEDGTDTAAPPWSFWGGTGGAISNPYPGTANSSARVWSNFGNPGYVNVAAQNNMNKVFLIPGAKYHIHAQYYVPASEVLAGVTPRAGIYLSMMNNPPGQYRVLDPRYPDNPTNPVSPNLPVDQWVTLDFDWTNPGTAIEQVNYGTFRLYGGDGTNIGNGTTASNPGGYFDNCQISSDAYTGVVSGVVKTSAGLASGANVQITYQGVVLQTAVTGADGAYQFAGLIPGESYVVEASKLNYLPKSATVTATAVVPDLVLDPNPDVDPDLIFAANSSTFVGANWPLAYSDTGVASLVKMNTPSQMTINGQNWIWNKYSTGDGFQYPGPNNSQWDAPITVNGATIVAAIRPVRNGIGTGWCSIVDIFYNRLVLGIRNDNGNIVVWRNGESQTGPSIPNGQITVLSLVVQPTGEYKVYANGTEVMNITTTSDMTMLNPLWNGGSTGFWSYINVGRNQPDGWTTFNGNIGDVKVYKLALDDTKRTTIEGNLTGKYGSAPIYTITATAGTGGTLTPSGAIPVPSNADQTFTITTDYGYVLSSVKVDGVEQGPITSYTFSNVTANHTIDVNWTEMPSISGTVSGPAGPIYSAAVSLSTNSDGSSPVVTRFSDSTGAYKVTPPASTGTYYLVAKKGGFVTSAVKTVVMAGVSVTGQDFLLAKSAGLDPLVNLDASALTAGTVTSWPNTGTLGGNFIPFDDTHAPEVNSAYGKQAVEFFQPSADATGRQTMVLDGIPTPDAITGKSDWTISVDIYRDDALVNSDNCYFQWAGRDWGTAATAQFSYRDNLAYVHYGADSGFATVPTSAAWHNVCITYDGTTEKVYVDGVQDRSDARALELKAAGLMMLGGANYRDMRGEDQYWRFNGAISKLKIYDQALSASEVAAESGAPIYNWKGANNGTWNNAANWNNAIPGLAYGDQTATFSDSPAAGATVDLDADAVELGGIIFNNMVANTNIMSTSGKILGLYKGADKTVELESQAGSHSISVGLEAVLAKVAKTGPGELILGGTNTFGKGLTASAGTLTIAGNTSVADATNANVDRGATMKITGTLTAGGADQIIGGNVEVSGNGAWNLNGSGVFAIANFSDTVGGEDHGVLTVKDNATVTVDRTAAGWTTSGWTTGGLTLGVGWGDGPQSGIVNQEGGTVNLTYFQNWSAGNGPGLILGGIIGGPVTAIYNLDGGTLNISAIFNLNMKDDGTGQYVLDAPGNIGQTAVFNFNGGLLKASQSDSTDAVAIAEGTAHLMGNLTHAYVKAGGAKINTNGFDCSINQALEHDTALGTTLDGGLIKSGTGALSLLVDSTYTGATKVQAGTLAAKTVNAIGGGDLDISAGATVALDYVGTHEVTKLSFAGVQQAGGTWGAVGSGADHTDARFTGTGLIKIKSNSTAVAKISDLKSIADGTVVQISGKNVTAIAGNGVPAGVFYIEEADRSSGLKINWASAVAVNAAATITGTFHKPASGEMYIDASAVTTAAGAATKPVFVTTSTLSGKLLDGMLVRVAGKVGTVGANYYIVNDGGVDTKVMTGGAPGVTTGSFVSVTGIGSYDGTVRAILQP